ncbi:MAG: hypothetical protein MZU97_26820 [Bacillus subtilis]|nr:hypothetical protein [Bacillus subtilis]
MSNKVSYSDENGKNYIIPNVNEIFNNSKASPVKKAFYIGIPVTIFTIGAFTIPAVVGVVAYTASANAKLEDNIKRINYKKDACLRLCL